VLTIFRRSQSLGAALVVLAMTAGVAFAAAGGVPGSSHAAWNRDQAGASEAPESQAPESEAPESDAPESEAPESEAPESEAPEDADSDSDAAVNHGALVSTAAEMDTPDGFVSHGAFVSCVAHMAHDVDPATFDWSTVTPESCGYVTDASGSDHSGTNGHGHGWGKARHHGARPN
jgi:hypothetical protein